MNKHSRIYVAGHTGMVGSSIMSKLKDEEYTEIHKSTSKNLDLRSQDKVKSFFDKGLFDHVFLSAARVGGILANSKYPANFIYDNIMISTNVIHAAYEHNVKRLINLGSSCIYPKFANQPITEDQLLNGYLEQTNEPYAIAKISAIKMVKYYKKQYGCDYISLMPTNLYGNNDNYNLETSHVIPALLRKFILANALKNSDTDFIKKDIAINPIGYNINSNSDITDIIKALECIGITKNSVEIWGTGNVYREFMHANDLADACLYFMNISDTSEIGELLNIGTGVDTQIKDIVDTIKNIVGYTGAIEFNSNKPEGPPKKLLNVDKSKDLGWTAKINITDGLNMVYQDYMKSHV